ncbi:hypothetical protein, partial [Sedimentitalea sp.]|uniref:hypothetical protein n=1 Tax=Sedimentitalea sp. TaxID=2048915 RepID=UPI00329A325A
FSIQIHGEDPPTLPPSKERAKMDDFYAARSRIIPPLPWSTFSPPFSPQVLWWNLTPVLTPDVFL